MSMSAGNSLLCLGMVETLKSLFYSIAPRIPLGQDCFFYKLDCWFVESGIVDCGLYEVGLWIVGLWEVVPNCPQHGPNGS